MMINNGKYGGGRMLLDPMATINDGYFEMIFYKGNWNQNALRMMTLAKKGGQQIFDEELKVYRIKKLKLTNKSFIENVQTKMSELRP